ncbi:EAL domain-containing protein [Sphingomonas sp.]|uniref:EAL domain-containing protein n=1 Tax=Sphingomonas sp. TaxID=28214 RepID=UPI002C236864|nr:EAL domain-containing protein [Sphingomonas sp.]HTG39346.1 EAL domain-containing protein [Sphingomonas sp.]
MTSDAETTLRSQTPLFVLSFRQRDEMAALVARGGWQAVAARRGEAVERRFRASGAAVALVDARGAFDDGLTATRALGSAAEPPGALLVCVSRADVERLSALYDAGATHFLSSPFGEAELLQALRFASRGTEPRGGGEAGRGLLGWRWDPERARVQLSPLLARLMKLPASLDRKSALRALPADERPALIEQLRSLKGASALVQTLPSLGRAVQHLQRDSRTARVLALIEPLGTPPDVAVMLQEAMPRVHDLAGARRWIDHALAEDATVEIIGITLERLEVVNLNHGRAVGDRLIQSVARRIGEVLAGAGGSRSVLARLEGAGFAVIARHPLDASMPLIEAALARPFVVEHELMQLGGRLRHIVAHRGDDATALLRALGDTTPVHERSGDALAIEVREAIDAGHIDILWQPQVAIASGAITGVEALARWRHPVLGELGAEALFAAADRAGLALALSEHVQALALNRAAAWPSALGGLRLSINVTAGDVANAGFAELLLERIDASGFPRARLTIEITESGLMAELGEAARLLAQLRRGGCRVAIDDFGTGYSSLAYLKALPLDYLKIDKALSQDIAGSPRDRIVVRGVIDMARSLGLAVVAEGVETEQQLELLAKEGCQYFQGFLFAPPIASDALQAMLTTAAASR